MAASQPWSGQLLRPPSQVPGMPLTSARLPGERGEHPSSPAARLPAQASLPPLHGPPTRGLGPHSRVAAVPRACARNSWLLQRLEVAAQGGFRQAAASSPGEGTALLRPSRWPRPRALLLLGSECPRQTGDVGSVRRTASWERNVPVLSGHTGRRPPYRAVPCRRGAFLPLQSMPLGRLSLDCGLGPQHPRCRAQGARPSEGFP